MRRVGVDAVAVDRIEMAVRRSGDGFLRRAFTDSELAYCAGKPDRLAGRWAAKEAIIKSFDGTGICFPRSRIEVLAGASGAPQVRLVGDSRGAHVQVSITHDGPVAVAMAMLELGGANGRPAPSPVPEAFQLPARPPAAHKGSFGTVVVVAGSRGLTGAAYLSSMAAARTGAGLVRLLVAETIYPILAVKCTEVMATPVPEVSPGTLGHVSLDAIRRQAVNAKAVVIGPGLGRDRSTSRLVHDFVAEVQIPMVIDADALNALSEQPRLLKKLGGERVLTPHPAEMGRLTKKSVAEIERDRSAAARQAARDWGVVVVLKGARTVVAAPDGRVSEDAHEVPALASGGTGDVLSGVIAALVAQGADAFTAAVSGVYLHAECGRVISARQGDSGLLASDLLPELPRLMQSLRRMSESP